MRPPSKINFLATVLTIIVLSVSANLYSLYRVTDLTQRGVQAHAANCSYLAFLYRQVQDSKQFINFTPKQREAKYGKALANIPIGTIQRSLHLQEAAVKALSGLQCRTD